MTNRQKLIDQIRSKKSFLCVGLDTDPDKIPPCIQSHHSPVLAFNKYIIDATRDLCVAYKPNLAFYEAMGPSGWEILQETLQYIGPDHLKIADAKRGDIGNTAERYARTFFENMGFDAVTVSPYMGRDAVEPFLAYRDKWTIVLGLTSNAGHADIQMQQLATGKYLFEDVVSQLCTWGDSEQLMLVVGATRSDYMEKVRSLAPNHFWLVPGVGAQGGSLSDVFRSGATDDVGLLVNSSRGILYASSDEDFQQKATQEASKLQQEMKALLTNKD